MLKDPLVPLGIPALSGNDPEAYTLKRVCLLVLAFNVKNDNIILRKEKKKRGEEGLTKTVDELDSPDSKK